MQCQDLTRIFGAIKVHSKYKTNTDIASKIGISEKTLRDYATSELKPNWIPDHNVSKFVALVKEISNNPISTEEAKNVLQGPVQLILQCVVHYGAGQWSELLRQADTQPPLKAIAKTIGRIGFGEIYEPEPEEVESVGFGQRFYFKGTLPWAAEGVLFCEHDTEFRFTELRRGQRLVTYDDDDIFLPKKDSDGNQAYFLERTKPGSYKYYFIAQRHSFSHRMRETLSQVNTLGQQALDMLAGQFLEIRPADLNVQYGEIYVRNPSTEIPMGTTKAT